MKFLKLFLVNIFLVSFSFNFLASKNDSLVEVYNDTSLSLLSRYGAVYNLVVLNLSKNVDSADYYYYKQLALAKELGEDKYINLAVFNKAVINQYSGKPDSAFLNYQYLRHHISEKDTFSYMRLINAIGNYHQDLGYLDTALIIYETLLNKSRQFNLKSYRALSFSNIAGTYMMIGYKDSSYKYHDSAYKLRLELNDSTNLAVSIAGKGNATMDLKKRKSLFLKAIKYDSIPYVFNDLAGIYNNYKQMDSALYYNSIALSINKRFGRRKWLADSYLTRGTIFFSYTNSVYLDSAELNFFRAREIYSLAKNISGVTRISYRLAQLNFKRKNYKKTINYALNSFENETNTSTKSSSAKILAESYALINDYKNAYKYELFLEELDLEDYKHNNVLNEERFNLETKHKLDSLENLKSKQILEAEKMVATKEKQNLRTILIFLVLGSISIVVFLYIIAKRLRTIREQKVIIEEQHELLNQSHKDVTDSINYAKRIQDALMTSSVYMKDILKDSFIIFKPKDVVSGDFYWVHKTLDNLVFFVVADCTGHGVPGAFMSMIGNSLLNEVIIEDKVTEPGLILDKLRELLIKSLKQQGGDENTKEGMDIALCKLDSKKLEIEYAGAFNPMFHIRDGVLSEYKPNNQPIGVYAGKKVPFTNHKIKVKKGDMIYISSDGYPDQFGGPKGKKFLKKRFSDMILKASMQPISAQEKLIETTLKDWMEGHEQIDDICVMGVRV